MNSPLVAQGRVLEQDSEMFCEKCGTVLLSCKAGEMAFSSVWCDCSWQCCDHSCTNTPIRGYKIHAAHLAFRPVTEVESDDPVQNGWVGSDGRP